MAYVVVYDACVLYPAPLRDFLLQLALTELFQAKWSESIHEEWIGGVLRDRPDLPQEKLQRTRELMNEAIPDAVVSGHESLIPTLDLPDPDDRHVLAAAIRSGAQAIITFNLRDFPAETLEMYDIEALDPDAFVERQLHLGLDKVRRAMKMHRARCARVLGACRRAAGTRKASPDVWSACCPINLESREADRALRDSGLSRLHKEIHRLERACFERLPGGGELPNDLIRQLRGALERYETGVDEVLSRRGRFIGARKSVGAGRG